MRRNLLIGLLLVHGLVYASDGDLDLAFGIGGKVTTDFFFRSDGANAVAIQPDGKIVAAGWSNYDFALARYNVDGSSDPTFGVGGKVTTIFDIPETRWALPSALAIHADGKIVGAGISSDRFDEYNGILVRYNSDGSLDATFGLGGVLITNVFYRSVVIQSDGKLIGAGYVYTQNGVQFALERYNSDGSADATFGAEGLVTMTFPGYMASTASSVAIQPDGKIVGGGAATYRLGQGYYSDFVLARYNKDGSLDCSFGYLGRVIESTSEDFWRSADLHQLIIQPDGKILTAGTVSPGPPANVGPHHNGSLDTTFGPGGVVTTEFDGSAAAAKTAIQPDGKIVAVGYSGTDFALARYTSAEPVRVKFDPPSVRIGSSFTAIFLGPNLKNETYFDIRYRMPNETTDRVTLNWQQGASASHRVPDSTAPGTWTFTGIRPHLDPNDATGLFYSSSATLTVNSMFLIDIRIEGGPFHPGDSFTATFTGENLTDDAYFDVRYRKPNSTMDEIALNWQRGTSASHTLPADVVTGTWAITGVWAHQDAADHSTDFAPVSAVLNVTPIVMTQPRGWFSTTGNMTVARTSHTATLLQDGRVLIAGGSTNASLGTPGEILSSAELFDPVSETFVATGSMTTARTGHTATLLPDGRVLLAGGASAYSSLSSAEIYDPSTGKFMPTGTMTSAQFWHTAMLLRNGKVLIAGGYASYPALAPAQLYDLITGTFLEAGSQQSILYGCDWCAPAALLPDGKVLFGRSQPAQIYDPLADTFRLAGEMVDADRFTATTLPNGRVLFTGGTWTGRSSTTELYDPSTNSFRSAAWMVDRRGQQSATLLSQGMVLIVGGETESCSNGACVFAGSLDTAELYDPTANTFTPTGKMAVRRSSHNATLLKDGRVLVTGGVSYGGIGLFNGSLAIAELYHP